MELIEKHRHEFYRYIRRTAWDSQAADDIFSSAVLAAWENRHKFTPGTNFRAWMFRIITNKCFVANRETSRTPQPLDEMPDGVFMDLSSDPEYRDVLKNPDKFLEECSDEVYMAFHQLSTAQRSCILLRSAEKYSYKEIASIMDIPVGTVMTHLARGRAKLRKELTEYARTRGLVRKMPRIMPKKDSADPERRVENGSEK